MKNKILACALLLGCMTVAQMAAAGDSFYLAANVPCKITRETWDVKKTMSFSTQNPQSGGYYDKEEYPENGFSKFWYVKNTFTAEAQDGFRFQGWYSKNAGWGSEGATVTNANDLVSSSDMITEDVIQKSAGTDHYLSETPVVFAKYIRIYDIMTAVDPADAGTVTGAGTYDEGSDVTLTATATEGWAFARWSDGNTDNPRTLAAIQASETYTAVFGKKTVNVTLDLKDGVSRIGYRTGGEGDYTYVNADAEVPVEYGSTCELIAEAAAGWSFGGSATTGETYSNLTSARTFGPSPSRSDYAVTVDPNGGSGGSCPGYTYSASLQTKSIVPPKRTGYTLSSWDVGGAFGGTPTVSGNTLTIPGGTYGNLTLTPSWSANDYTVKFNTNGGSGTMAEQPFTYDEPQALMGNSYEKTGYGFNGWNTSPNGSGTAYGEMETVSNLTATAGGNVYLYAQWTPNTYSVRFNKNGGEGTMPDQAFAYAQEQKLNANLFTRSGYDFTGWCTQPDGIGGTTYLDGASVKNLTTENNSVVTLYAQWSGRGFTVTFDANGGTAPSPASKTVNYALTYGKLATCSRTGHVFLGWWMALEGGEQVTSETTVELEDNQTLYAHWEAVKYCIHFASGGGAGTMDDQAGISYGTEVTLTSNAFTKGIQRFKRWQGSDGKFYADGATVSNLLTTSGGVHTNTATWRNDFLVAFDGNGATNTVMAPQLIDADDPPQTLKANEYERTGYAFLGWDDVQAGARYSEPVALTKALTSVGATNVLLAAWKANDYTVKFDANGGTGTMADQVFAYDTPQALSANGFKNNRYTFLGWATGRADEVAYRDRECVSNLTAVADGIVTLYARWDDPARTNELSIAADCNTNRVDGRVALQLITDNGKYCTVKEVPDMGGNGQCVCIKPDEEIEGWHGNKVLTVTRGAGRLEFDYQTKVAYQGFSHLSVTTNGEEIAKVDSTTEKWTSCSVSISAQDEVKIEWLFQVKYGSDRDYALIDNIRWIPEETRDEPTDEDAVTISSAAVAGDAFKLSFVSDAKFDYNLLTNANLLIDSWGVMETKPGTGETVTFEPLIIDGMPQLFYRVETIRKQD